MDNALAPVSDKAIVGFDMEWKPNHRAGQNNPTALVQIASLNAVVLVHIHHMMVMARHYSHIIPFGAQVLGQRQDGVPRFVSSAPLTILHVTATLRAGLSWAMQDPRDHKPGYVPRGLKYILSTTNVIKLGIGIREDFEKLKDDYPDVAPRNYVDLAVVAAAYGMSERGLKSMYVEVVCAL